MLKNRKYAIIYKEKVGSSNDYLKELLAQDFSSQNEIFLIAKEQTKGRGQFARKWLSEADKGLYLSYLFYPGLELLPYINHWVAAVLVNLLAEYGINGYIKLPNDIYVADRKIAGILTESVIAGEKVKGVIIGIGLNLYYERGDFKDIKGTSMFIESKKLINKKKLEQQIINKLIELKSKTIEEIEIEFKKHKIIT